MPMNEAGNSWEFGCTVSFKGMWSCAGLSACAHVAANRAASSKKIVVIIIIFAIIIMISLSTVITLGI
eukprot:5890996-Pyramimonas_sp.AAC.1